MLENSAINSFSMKHQINVNDFVDIPPATYHSNTFDRLMMDNEYSYNKDYLKPMMNVNQSNYISNDLAHSLSQRFSYCSTTTASESQYIPSLKTLMNYSFSEIHDSRKNKSQKSLEHKQSKISSNITTNGMVASSVVSSRVSSSVIPHSLLGNNNSLGRGNMKSIPVINDDTNLHENSFQSNTSHISYTNTNTPQNATTQDHSFYNSHNTMISLQKSPSSKAYPLDTGITSQSLLHPNQQNISINLSKFHIGPNISIEELDDDDMDQNRNIDDIDAIVDDAENILECLSHHSLTSSNIQAASLLDNNSPKTLHSIAGSNITFKTSDFLYNPNQNAVDIMVNGTNTDVTQHRNNNYSRSFQKTIPLEVQPSVETCTKKIPEEGIEIANNKSESVIDQSGYNTSYVSVKRSRSYLGSKRAEKKEKNGKTVKGQQNKDIIPKELKINNEVDYPINDENIKYKNKSIQESHNYIYLKDNSNDIDTDFSKVKVQKVTDLNPPSPNMTYKNINSNYLNYKKAQIKNDSMDYSNKEINIKSKSFNTMNFHNPALSIKTKNLNDEVMEKPDSCNNQIVRESHLLNQDTTNNFNSPTTNGNNSFIQNSILKSPTNFFIRSPLSPIMSVDEMDENDLVFNIAQKPNILTEDLINTNKIENSINPDSTINEICQPNNKKSIKRDISYDESHVPSKTVKTPKRAFSYNDYNNSTIGRFSRNIYNNGSMDRSYMINDNNRIRNSSQKSIAINSLNRNQYNTSLSRYSTLSRTDNPDSSILTESTSVISVENIDPAENHTHKLQKLNNSQMNQPSLRKVEINYAIDEIPEDIDINDNLEESVSIIPSVMRVVNVESSPIILHEAQTTRISYISSQSSELPTNILSQELLNSFSSNIKSPKMEEEDEDKTAKNEKIDSSIIGMSPTSPYSNEIIIKTEETSLSTSEDYDINEINNRNSSSCIELLKNNNSSSNEEDFSSPTLNENADSSNLLKDDITKSLSKIDEILKV
ncbi:hypothetical protein BCR36DRAFT_580008 [Piromyces finnis]|uniref:Uncharacterized protein n=1 Tax=Piromyces finnis TaxID=1754191 RepID=A0A1Y1VKH4_9FUNG|nr:hypothetical protein BCR36DRAFT_580008 [Piromyces finnis]|eukprot:ORX58386.1 hypothetical protein BCR36DRAFT_580008 [Piromyces finnis]